MSSEEEPRVLLDLHLLLARGLGEASREALIQGVKDAKMCKAKNPEWTGRVVAQLKQRHGLSWLELERLTEVPKGTLIRQAKPYL